MIPHFVLLMGVSLLARLAQLRSLSRPSWILVVVGMGLFAGLRGDTVGADTVAYVNRFKYMVMIDAVWDTAGSADPGYKLILSLSLLISDNPTSLLVISSIIASILYVTSIYRLSIIPSLSIFIFIAFGFYSFHMNGLRQGLALGIYLHAIPALILRKPVRYTIWVLLASLFHATAIFTLPLYYLLRKGISPQTIALLALASVLTAVSMDTVLAIAGMANERYASYGQRTETGGSMLALFHLLCAVAFLFSYKFIVRELRYIYGIFSLMFLYGTTIHILVLLSQSYIEMTRMAIYFTVVIVFICPIILVSIRDIRNRTAFLIILILAGCGFYFIYLQQIGNFVPYVMR